jgi:hypothetical protein
VDYEGGSLLCGAHPQLLPDAEAKNVLLEVLLEFDEPPGDGLRHALIREGDDLVAEAWRYGVREALRRPVPTHLSPEGEPLVEVIDTYSFAPTSRPRLVARLRRSKRFQFDLKAGAKRYYTVRPSGSRGVPPSPRHDKRARMILDQQSLEVRTRTTSLADAMVDLLAETLGGRLSFVSRSATDMLDFHASRLGTPLFVRNAVKTRGAVEIRRAFKARQYQAWLDARLPALDGLAPRKSAARPELRARLDRLLREMQAAEDRLPAEERHDLAPLREALGLRPDPGPRP